MSKTPTLQQQLEKKLYRACIGSNGSGDEVINALILTLVSIVENHTDRQKWELMGRTVALQILTEFNVSTSVATVLLPHEGATP